MVNDFATEQGLTNSLPALAILGPTASGKSGLSMWLAQQGYPVEIISLDSALVYRGMDIGTAKPSSLEQQQVVHHLIDIIDPTEVFNASDFSQRCLDLIEEIRLRGNIPLIVGGTMMYYKSLISGLDDMPAKDLQIRERIEAQAKNKGWPYMHQLLAKIDPVTALRLKPNDSQRIERALEVYQISGKPMSAYHQRGGTKQNEIATLSLEPADRSLLHSRIAHRFDQMLKCGFIEEVEALRRQFNLTADMPSMRCVGYRQAWEYLDNRVSVEEFREKGIAATRQLAKRQITWLRSTEPKTVVDPFDSNWQQRAKDWFDKASSKLR